MRFRAPVWTWRWIKTVFACFFAFIFGSTVMLMYIDPERCNMRQCTNIQLAVDPAHSNNWLVNAPSLQSQLRKNIDVTLLILIASAPDNFERRSALRQTWLKYGVDDVAHYFVIGTRGSLTEQKETLESEQKRFHDLLLYADIEDTYLVLTRKLLMAIVWLRANVGFKFMLKCDDDSFVRVGDVLAELDAMQDSARLYWGFFDGRSPVHRHGKWKESDWTLCEHYLPYAKGGGYILSSDLVAYLADNAPMLKLFVNEDVSVGAWLAALDIRRIHDPRFDTEYQSRGCNNKYLITHKQDVPSIKNLYDNLKNYNVLCTSEFQLRKSYVYNWNVSPNQCCSRTNASIP